MGLGVLETIVSSEPIVVFDAHTRVVFLNKPAEALLGTTSSEALGKSCQAVLHGRSPEGRLSCLGDCRVSRAARHGWPVPRTEMTVDTVTGPQRISVSTIVLLGRDGPLLCRVLHENVAATGDGQARVASELTSRQLEVLRLLANGVTARGVATRLGITEATVRNHIRAILVELSAHSQLEAVARARDLGLVA